MSVDKRMLAEDKELEEFESEETREFNRLLKGFFAAAPRHPTPHASGGVELLKLSKGQLEALQFLR